MQQFKSGAEMSEYLKDKTRRHYGHAGRAFIKFIISELQGDDGDVEHEKRFRANLADDIRDFVSDLELPEHTAEEVRRIAKTFGLFAAAGKFAVDAGILPHTENQVDEAITACFHDYIQQRGGVEKRSGTSAIVLLRDFLHQNQHRFADLKDGTAEVGNIRELAGYRRKGTGKALDQGDWFFFLPRVWQDDVEAQAPRANLTEKLLAKGLLQRSESVAKAGKWQEEHKLPAPQPKNTTEPENE